MEPRNLTGEVAERLRRSTVQVLTSGRRGGGGSGVVWAADGVIVTNAHVASASEATVELWDGRRLRATVAARDPQRDLATLRIEATGLAVASFGDSAALRPGEMVLAVGNPLGFIGALTTGIVHSIGPIRGMGPQSWVRAGVRLAPGNSGGPLANAQGQVIGINTAIVQGLGVAVPSNAVAAWMRRGERPAVGVALRPVGFGLLLVEVVRGGPAANASLWVGDILTAANGRPVQEVDDLAAVLDAAGELLDIEFLRGDRTRRRHATVRLRPRVAEAA